MSKPRPRPDQLCRCRDCGAEWDATVETPEGWAACPECSSDSVKVMCGAHARSNDRGRCEKEVPGDTGGRCHNHGKKKLVGTANPNFRTGKYSRFAPQMPDHYRQIFEDMRRDPELTGLRDQIALVDTMIYHALPLATTETSESAKAWIDAKVILDKARAAGTSGRGAQVPGILRELDAVLTRGAGYGEARGEVLRFIEQRRRLSETENKTMATRRGMLTPEQADVLAYQFGDMAHQLASRLITEFAKHVQIDPDTLASIKAQALSAMAGEAAAIGHHLGVSDPAVLEDDQDDDSVN